MNLVTLSSGRCAVTLSSHFLCHEFSESGDTFEADEVTVDHMYQGISSESCMFSTEVEQYKAAIVSKIDEECGKKMHNISGL